jgi:hypothetical protein
MPFHCARGTYAKNEEPTLEELLAEPIVRLLMARDGVDEADLRQLFICSHMRLHAADEGRFQELADGVFRGW